MGALWEKSRGSPPGLPAPRPQGRTRPEMPEARPSQPPMRAVTTGKAMISYAQRRRQVATHPAAPASPGLRNALLQAGRDALRPLG